MKRRQLKQIVSMLLAVVMAVGLLPTTAFAADPPDIPEYTPPQKPEGGSYDFSRSEKLSNGLMYSIYSYYDPDGPILVAELVIHKDPDADPSATFSMEDYSHGEAPWNQPVGGTTAFSLHRV